MLPWLSFQLVLPLEKGTGSVWGEREVHSLSYKLVKGLVCQKSVPADWLWSICSHILKCDRALEYIEQNVSCRGSHVAR